MSQSLFLTLNLLPAMPKSHLATHSPANSFHSKALADVLSLVEASSFSSSSPFQLLILDARSHQALITMFIYKFNSITQ